MRWREIISMNDLHNDTNDCNGLIKSVQKSLIIMKYIINSPNEVSLADIEKAFGYNISTVHHMLKTLMIEGFVSQNKISRKYDIGPEIFFSTIGNKKTERYFNRLIPILQDCVEATGETTNFFIRDDEVALCVNGCESNQILKASLLVGRKIPLTCTAAGKVFLSHLTINELQSFISRIGLRKFMTRTITDYKILLEDLDRSRILGYTIESDEYEEMITAIGVPVYDDNKKVICALTTIAPSIRIDDQKIIQIVDVLKQASVSITKILRDSVY